MRRRHVRLDLDQVSRLTRNPVRRAVLGMMAVHRFHNHNSIGGQTPAEKAKFAKQVEQYKEEAERVSALLKWTGLTLTEFQEDVKEVIAPSTT